ncbi:hypothetical protein [Ferruginibacter albus]|uniref:hypothetical protein n=1 Tax=Ferruginibacter albus TaxID=2875540 RepID=UPI001CC526F1|nr:hypothetical protein [Ferruginibacter albus]UAY52746.1 hypothetical protein K9M53_03400 [Ferruginibacter albus]
MKNINYDELIDECNRKRAKIYYNLTQLIEITGLSPRMLKYRMKENIVKYKNIPSLLYKSGKQWRIHASIIKDFLPKRRRKKNSILTYEWKTFATWILKDNYTADYHLELIQQIQQLIQPFKIHFTIEKSKRGIFHVHFLSDVDKSSLIVAIKQILEKYLTKNEYRVEVNEINNKYSALHYIRKAPVDIIIKE